MMCGYKRRLVGTAYAKLEVGIFEMPLYRRAYACNHIRFFVPTQVKVQIFICQKPFMIISYQLKVFSGQSQVTCDEFEHKKLIFSIELEFYQKRSQQPILVTEIQSYKTETKQMSKNVSESILHGRNETILCIFYICKFLV